MTPRAAWFIAGLVMVSLLSFYAPRLAGVIVILVAVYVASKLAEKGLITP